MLSLIFGSVMPQESILILSLPLVIFRIEDRITRHSFEVNHYHLHLMKLRTSTIGQQVTDGQGVAVFDTIYPGWYPKRATHVHVIVHVGASLLNMGGAIYTRGGHVSYTGQIFFNDTLTDEVANISPYTLVKIRRVRNEEDVIYSQFRGSTTIIPVRYLTSNGLRGAVSGDITLGINPNTIITSTVGRP